MSTSEVSNLIDDQLVIGPRTRGFDSPDRSLGGASADGKDRAISLQQWNDKYPQFLAAIRGERIPDFLNSAYAFASVVRGIRCHYTFATSRAVTELCFSHPSPQFIRARNARLIMSNEIPESHEMNHRQLPYCIWYPDFATEETYRRLAVCYPEMKYHVGRACAAAGFANLYNELDLLPDVSIAEEARESGTEGGSLIFRSIMAAPFRYAIMNDYTLSVNTKTPRFPALLNGDTDVRWRLGYRIGMNYMERNDCCISPCIEEDRRIDMKSVKMTKAHSHLTHDEIQFLSEPLGDLPTIKKTLLIEMAAYEGNVDRYARLCRPNVMPKVELVCVVRGIYHHTTFASWWKNQIKKNSPRIQMLRFTPCLDSIKKAISARRIMINDTQEFHKGWNSESPRPFIIWWPLKPHHVTLTALARRVPSMKEQAAIACIFCDYYKAYNSIDVKPTTQLWMAAKQSPNPFYLADLEKKAAEQGLIIDNPKMMDDYDGSMEPDLERTGYRFATDVRDGMEITDLYLRSYYSGGAYVGHTPIVGPINKRIFASLELVRKLDEFRNGSFAFDTAITENWVLPVSSA